MLECDNQAHWRIGKLNPSYPSHLSLLGLQERSSTLQNRTDRHTDNIEDTSLHSSYKDRTSTMGLALHDSTSELARLAEHRHLPPGPAHDKPSSRLEKDKADLWRFRYESAQILSYPKPRELRPYQLAALAAYHRSAPSGKDAPVRRSYLHSQARLAWEDEDESGRDLARSDVPLPSDGHRRRPPSLERQEAFRDARTVKRRTTIDDAELYRLGLLYDDEHERGSGFNLDAIVHDEPAYTLNMRPAKRGRKRKSDQAHGPVRDLPLNLSFAALGDDEALAHFLISPDEDEIYSAYDTETHAFGSTAADTAAAPLHIVYELEHSIYSPAISLYDLHSLDNRAPDLISDISDEDDDWALLNELHGDNDAPGAAHDTASTSTDEEDEQHEEERGRIRRQNSDAWVVLG